MCFAPLTDLLLWEAEAHLPLSYWLLLFFVAPPTSWLPPQKPLLLCSWSVGAAPYWSVLALNKFSDLKPHWKKKKRGRNNRRRRGCTQAKPRSREWLLRKMAMRHVIALCCNLVFALHVLGLARFPEVLFVCSYSEQKMWFLGKVIVNRTTWNSTGQIPTK